MPYCRDPVLVHQETGNSQGTSHPQPAERDSRQAIQTWPDHSNRVVPSPRSVSSHMLPVGPTSFATRFNKLPHCHWFQILRLGQWMHSARLGKIWTHMPSYQQPSWAPPLKDIADFLLHLFQDRKLQPGTIDGYRSAIADKLGNSTINISKDENLTRLLDSFQRDRPKGSRGIPSWNLSQGDKEKSELDPKQVFNFVGYQFDLREGKVRPTPERWQTLADKILSVLSGPVCPVRQFMSLIGLLTARKTSPPRSTSYETHTVAFEKQLEDIRITGKGDTRSQVAPPPLKVVAGGKQRAL